MYGTYPRQPGNAKVDDLRNMTIDIRLRVGDVKSIGFPTDDFDKLVGDLTEAATITLEQAGEFTRARKFTYMGVVFYAEDAE